MWQSMCAKLYKDSNLDKVFTYSLLNNMVSKQSTPQTSQRSKQKDFFLTEFLKNMNMNMNMKSKQNSTDILTTILTNINMDEFMQTDYSNPNYNIFESCGIDLPLYELMIEYPDGTLNTDNAVVSPTSHAPVSAESNITEMGRTIYNRQPLLLVDSQAGGFYRKTHRTKNYIKNKKKNNKKSKIINGNGNGNKITRKPIKHSQIKGYKYKKTSKI